MYFDATYTNGQSQLKFSTYADLTDRMPQWRQWHVTLHKLNLKEVYGPSFVICD